MKPKSVDALLASIARTVGGTYCVAGDAAPIEDDQALGMIRDVLDEWDPNLMENATKKRKAASRS